ncbi:MAG TPA: phenylalanine--tRNA ligase subunit beta, partial [Candidatus Hydrogenedentes bacterium]|nr:phenylalanine--tRNA ligase subunit beta [Candidatus Hydrogenedentota bacterium]
AESFEIGARKMRGVESQGMMCSARELGLGEDHTGLMILPPDTAVGEDAIPLLGLDDVIFEIEVTPNRGDWACMIGVARELAAYYGLELRIPTLQFIESAEEVSSLSSVTIQDPDLCPRYLGRVLMDVQVGPSPQWMCRRLIAAGQRPISNIVDITNYVLMETGHPLHAFDYALLRENRIVVRRAKPGETMVSIDGEERKLGGDMLIIADAEVPVAVAGIMGGKDSEVNDGTRAIFLESAVFNPSSIRKTARTLGMQTEASMRFQRGADFDMAYYACNRAAMLMQQLAGARIARNVLDENPIKPSPKHITLRYSRSNALLGTPVEPESQRGIIERLGFAIVASDDVSCTVKVPSWRHDASQEADLIEEIARFHGYDRIAATLPFIRQSGEVFAPGENIIRDLRRYLTGLGLTEFFNWTFSCADDVSKSGLDESFQEMVVLQNPLSEKLATMRSSLIPGLFNTVSRNVRHGNPDIMAFEIGPVYRPRPGQPLPKQEMRAGIVLCGKNGPKQWSRPQLALDFHDLKGYTEAVLDYFATKAVFEDDTFGPFQPGQCGKVVVNGKTIGRLGEVREAILKTYDIDQPVFVCELDLETLISTPIPIKRFEPIPSFPPSRRDLAVLVDMEVPAGALRDAALETGGKWLVSVEIFDVYAGKQVPDGKKSVALSLVFQSNEKTLTDAETQKAWDRILKRLQTGFAAELR